MLTCPKEILVNGEYRINSKIKPKEGLIYLGTELSSNAEVVLKLRRSSDKEAEKSLQHEVNICKTLEMGSGMPRILWHGLDGDYHVLVMQALGPSLQDVLQYCGGVLSLKTVLLIGEQLLARIKYVHSKGILHRNITPHHLLLGLRSHGGTIYLIDYKLACYKGETLGSDSDQEKQSYEFSSLRVSSGQEATWADDIESLAYIMIYMLKGNLPWKTAECISNPQSTALTVRNIKIITPLEQLCRELPRELEEFLLYARNLQINDIPDYNLLRNLLQIAFRKAGFVRNTVFDWTEKLYYEALDRGKSAQ